MGSILPLDKMTTQEKLQAMEELWDDLRRSPEEFPSPTWHADVLAARESRVRSGTAKFKDWAKAKNEIFRAT